MSTNRTDFIETWLTEMPYGIEPIEYNIKDRIKSGSKPIQISENLFKIEGEQVSYYWYQIDGKIVLAVELSVKPQGLVVTGLGKDSNYQGKQPYATDLYNDILNDSNRSIKLLSDTDLSKDGLSVWERLFKAGHVISIYNNSLPGKSFETLYSIDELRKHYNSDDLKCRNTQYVLSESGEHLAETRSYFNTRRMRELSGLILTD